jgi:LAO/AO transport system kinase
MAGPRVPDPKTLAEAVSRADRQAVAHALNLLDDQRREAQEAALELLSSLDSQRLQSGGHLIGVTGPPGAGKSSLLSALIGPWCDKGLKVAVLAVDPSSPTTGGALLGDRLRMTQAGQYPGLFIRSLASRRQLGGVAAEAWPMSQVMISGFDIVLIETVGVGQSEVDIAGMVDTTVYVVQPASGDSIQFIKSGIMEVPDLMVVNKSDLGAPAVKAANDLKQVVQRSHPGDGWQVPVCSVSARDRKGIEELATTLEQHRHYLAGSGKLAPGRAGHQASWVIRQLREDFGSWGLEQLGGEQQVRQDIAALNQSGEVMKCYDRWTRQWRRATVIKQC